MFRIDDNCVVDATMSGGPARYVNHSCYPNCVAEVVPFEKDSKIIIITKRKISQGEEVRLYLLLRCPFLHVNCLGRLAAYTIHEWVTLKFWLHASKLY